MSERVTFGRTRGPFAENICQPCEPAAESIDFSGPMARAWTLAP